MAASNRPRWQWSACETPSHPYQPDLEAAMLAPKAEMTYSPIPLAVRHVRTFLKANRPA